MGLQGTTNLSPDTRPPHAPAMAPRLLLLLLATGAAHAHTPSPSPALRSPATSAFAAWARGAAAMAGPPTPAFVEQGLALAAARDMELAAAFDGRHDVTFVCAASATLPQQVRDKLPPAVSSVLDDSPFSGFAVLAPAAPPAPRTVTLCDGGKNAVRGTELEFHIAPQDDGFRYTTAGVEEVVGEAGSCPVSGVILRRGRHLLVCGQPTYEELQTEEVRSALWVYKDAPQIAAVAEAAEAEAAAAAAAAGGEEPAPEGGDGEGGEGEQGEGEEQFEGEGDEPAPEGEQEA